MILANDFLEYLLNTERDLAACVRDRYDMYLKSLPVPQLADGKIVIDGRYMIDSHEGNYRLYRIEGGTPSVIGIYQRPSSAIVDVIAAPPADCLALPRPKNMYASSTPIPGPGLASIRKKMDLPSSWDC